MNAEIAKKILLLYRPGTADIEDPEFTEALDFVRQDENLRRWFDDQCTAREMIRVRFKQIPIPEGLKEQIVSERPWKALGVSRREIVALASFVGVAVLLGFVLLWSRPHPSENPLATFRERMVSLALRTYGMDLTTDNLNEIRSYLTAHNVHGNYVLPAGITKAAAAGCALTSWRGQSVSMICFKTGRPLSPGQPSDLWLFVVDRNSIPDTGIGESPQINKINRLTTASWTQGENIYVLAVDGDEEVLRNYL